MSAQVNAGTTRDSPLSINGRTRGCHAAAGLSWQVQALLRLAAERAIGKGASALAQTPSRSSKRVLRAINVFEALQGLGAQREAQAGSLRRVHSPVRPNIKRLVEQFPHHRHVALAHL